MSPASTTFRAPSSTVCSPAGSLGATSFFDPCHVGLHRRSRGEVGIEAAQAVLQMRSIVFDWRLFVDLFDASKFRFAWVFNAADVSIDLGIALILLAALPPSLETRAAANGNNQTG
jgi:hypothetical protein